MSLLSKTNSESLSLDGLATHRKYFWYFSWSWNLTFFVKYVQYLKLFVQICLCITCHPVSYQPCDIPMVLMLIFHAFSYPSNGGSDIDRGLWADHVLGDSRRAPDQGDPHQVPPVCPPSGGRLVRHTWGRRTQHQTVWVRHTFNYVNWSLSFAALKMFSVFS